MTSITDEEKVHKSIFNTILVTIPTIVLHNVVQIHVMVVDCDHRKNARKHLSYEKRNTIDTIIENGDAGNLSLFSLSEKRHY